VTLSLNFAYLFIADIETASALCMKLCGHFSACCCCMYCQ